MADTCDITATRAAILAAIEAQAPAGEAARQAYAAAAEHLLTLVNAYPGVWVPTAGGDLPVLAEILGRIRNPGGWWEWSYWEARAEPLAALVAPVALSGPWRASLNGALLGPDDISISGAAVTLSAPLEPGDLLTLKSYGAPT